eukprot:TRINITY_DN26789_c0_g1_i1.p1 TRINITY_DN26789_c0_g1~~TRINITY_DN26789_c0_g1_i1.p1  ORF type:complete len:432 (+),score=72.02 TRINITY_DN26789_c0_g1_i1:62-1297(+)
MEGLAAAHAGAPRTLLCLCLAPCLPLAAFCVARAAGRMLGSSGPHARAERPARAEGPPLQCSACAAVPPACQDAASLAALGKRVARGLDLGPLCCSTAGCSSPGASPGAVRALLDRLRGLRVLCVGDSTISELCAALVWLLRAAAGGSAAATRDAVVPAPGSGAAAVLQREIRRGVATAARRWRALGTGWCVSWTEWFYYRPGKEGSFQPPTAAVLRGTGSHSCPDAGGVAVAVVNAGLHLLHLGTVRPWAYAVREPRDALRSYENLVSATVAALLNATPGGAVVWVTTHHVLQDAFIDARRPYRTVSRRCAGADASRCSEFAACREALGVQQCAASALSAEGAAGLNRRALAALREVSPRRPVSVLDDWAITRWRASSTADGRHYTALELPAARLLLDHAAAHARPRSVW